QRQDIDQDDEADQAVGGSPEDGGEGSELRGALLIRGSVTIRKPARALDEEAGDAHEEGGNEQEEEELRQIVLDESERIAMPDAENVSEVQITLREGVWKDHY